MNLNQRPVECVKLYADSLRKTIRLLTVNLKNLFYLALMVVPQS
jgi:hypothetical protein